MRIFSIAKHNTLTEMLKFSKKKTKTTNTAPNVAIEGVSSDSIIRHTKNEWHTYEVFLDEEICAPVYYRELISLLFNSSEDDKFVFYLNTPGGDLISTRAIIEGIKKSEATVTGVLIGQVCSGGSLIAMYCHELTVLDSAEMMIHTAYSSTEGIMGNVKAQTDFIVSQVENLIDEAYEGFLDSQEIADIKKGVEFWFSADDIRERFTKRAELYEAYRQKQESNQISVEK